MGVEEVKEVAGAVDLTLSSKNTIDQIITINRDLTGFQFESYIYLDINELKKINIDVTVVSIISSVTTIRLYCDDLTLDKIRRNVVGAEWLFRWIEPTTLKERVILQGRVVIE